MRDDGVSSMEASIRAGITFRQLDHWDRRGVISPSVHPGEGSGTRRIWSRHDVDRLIVCGRLNRLGRHVDTDLVRALWEWLGARGRWPEFVTITRTGPRIHVHAGAEPIGDANVVVSTVGTRTAAVGELFEDGDQARLITDGAPL